MAKFFVGESIISIADGHIMPEFSIHAINHRQYVLDSGGIKSELPVSFIDKQYKLNIGGRRDSHVQKLSLPFPPWEVSYRPS